MKSVMIVHPDSSFNKQVSADISNIFTTVHQVSSISDAEKIIMNEPIEILICAAEMSDGCGLEFCKRIKNNDDLYKTQIVIIDDHYKKKNQKKSFSNGAVYYFSKDYALENLSESFDNMYSMTKVVAHGGGTVLLLEANTVERNFVKGLLSLAGLTVHDFSSKESAISFIDQNSVQVDLFLIGETFAGASEAEILEYVRGLRNYHNSPVLVIADEIDLVIKYKLFLLGVTDYIIKPFDVCEFFLKLKTQLKMNYIMEMLDAKNKLLAIKATTDELTGLFNRRFFWEMVKKEVSRSHRKKMVFSVVMIDIDNFKSVNDTFGHVVGDEVLVGIAETLQKELRRSDTVARFGGEEFIILLPETDIKQAFYVADKIRSIISKMTFLSLNKPVTVSGGVAESTESEDYEALIVISDERLYKAKNTGKNRVVYD